MARLIDTKRDLGKVIGGLAKGAVGFSGIGAPQSFSTAAEGPHGKRKFRMGERLARGVHAMQADSVGDFLTEEATIEKSKTATRYNAALARKYELENEAANKPFHWGEKLNNVDPTGALTEKIDGYLKNSGVDYNGDGTITEKEFQEGIQKNLIGMDEISGMVYETTSATAERVEKMGGEVNAALEKLGEKPSAQQQTQAGSAVGTSVFTREDFNDPSIAALYPKIAKLIAAENQLTETLEGQKEAYRRASNFAMRGKPLTMDQLKSKATDAFAKQLQVQNGASTPDALINAILTVGGKTLESAFISQTGNSLASTPLDALQKMTDDTKMGIAGKIFKTDIIARTYYEDLFDGIMEKKQADAQAQAQWEKNKNTVQYEGGTMPLSHMQGGQSIADELSTGLSERDEETLRQMQMDQVNE
jgi:hypothetical protein|tara:strand:+ start:68 stop:1324 length:1257 start_codon:yes stop_codon:yes gene_type:complete